nr:unnamed protein product [Spirometra erinaceieuropaei]
MPFWCWIAVRWFCGGSTFFIPTINSFVHVVMYTYYGLAAFRPNWTLYLMYKHLLTVLQLVQFFICMLFGLTLLLVRCDFIPVQLVYVGLTYGATIIGLFLNFYISAYSRDRKKTLRQSNQLREHAD